METFKAARLENNLTNLSELRLMQHYKIKTGPSWKLMVAMDELQRATALVGESVNTSLQPRAWRQRVVFFNQFSKYICIKFLQQNNT